VGVVNVTLGLVIADPFNSVRPYETATRIGREEVDGKGGAGHKECVLSVRETSVMDALRILSELFLDSILLRSRESEEIHNPER
jgi:hypothetical protein